VALAQGRRVKAAVVVAKLDRLTGDMAFLSGLMSQGVPFIVAELGPKADPFMIHGYGALGEYERSTISERTRTALARKKAAGAIFGNQTNLGLAQAMGQATNRVKADGFATNVLPIVQQIQAKGVTTARAIAAALNDRGIPTARGGTWHHSTVRNILLRDQVSQSRPDELPIPLIRGDFVPPSPDPMPLSPLPWSWSPKDLIPVKMPRGKPRGPTRPDKDKALLWLYDTLVDDAKNNSLSIKSLPRRIGEHLHNDVPGRFGNTAIAIKIHLRRLLKARANSPEGLFEILAAMGQGRWDLAQIGLDNS